MKRFLLILLILGLSADRSERVSAQVLTNNGAAVSLSPGAALMSRDITNSSGTITNNGTIQLSGSYTNAGGTSGNGTYRLAGDWTNNGIFAPGTGTVSFNGTGPQNIYSSGGTQIFNNVIIESASSTIAGGSSTLSVAGATTVSSGANLRLPAGAMLTFEPGASVTTTGTGKIILDAGANYINLGSSAPMLEVKRQFTGTEGWRMVVAPNNVTVGQMFASPFVTQGFVGSSHPSLQPNLLWWDETSVGTSLQAWRSPSATSDTVRMGRGYLFYLFNGAQRPDTASKYYSDILPLTMTTLGAETPLATAFDFGVTATSRLPGGSSGTTYVDTNAADYGWNLVGNPSPSTINWNASSGWTKTHIDSTIYVWDPADTAGGYKTWNGLTGNLGSGLIAPFQAFWVKANSATPQLICSNSVKSTGGHPLGKMAKVSTPSAAILSMTLSANGLRAEAYLMFNNRCKMSYDPYDAFSLVPLSDTYLILYSVAGVGQPAMQIQALPDTGFAEPVTLPLYVGGKAGGQPLTGTLTLRWKLNGEFPDGWNIMLMDDAAGKAYTMTAAGEVTFLHNTPADLTPSSSDNLGKNIDSLSIQRRLSMPPPPVVFKVPASGLSKSVAASRFRLVISVHSGLTGYLPSTPALAQNYPNPFNPATNIAFSLPARSQVMIEIFNVLGQKVATVTNQEYPAGNHVVSWNGIEVSSGIYFCRMTVAATRQTIKMLLLR